MAVLIQLLQDHSYSMLYTSWLGQAVVDLAVNKRQSFCVTCCQLLSAVCFSAVESIFQEHVEARDVKWPPPVWDLRAVI